MTSQAPDLDHYTGQNPDRYGDQFEYQEPDSPDDRRARYGGTDLFRGVIVVLLALAVGGYLLTRTLDAPGSGTDDEVAATDAVGGQDPASSEGVGGVVDDATAGGTGDAMTGDTATGDSVDGTAAAGGATTDTIVDDSATDEAAGVGDPMEDPADGDTTEADSDDTTATTAAIRPPGEVTVEVLNATDRAGIAGQATDLLSLAGYATADAGNALETQPSAILYAEGFEAEALAVAATFGSGLESLVQPMDPAVALSEDPAGADVIVVLGSDDVIPI